MSVRTNGLAPSVKIPYFGGETSAVTVDAEKPG